MQQQPVGAVFAIRNHSSINKTMTENTNTGTQTTYQKPQKEQEFNEVAGFVLSSTLKITDPNTGEVMLHQRAD